MKRTVYKDAQNILEWVKRTISVFTVNISLWKSLKHVGLCLNTFSEQNGVIRVWIPHIIENKLNKTIETRCFWITRITINYIVRKHRWLEPFSNLSYMKNNVIFNNQCIQYLIYALSQQKNMKKIKAIKF